MVQESLIFHIARESAVCRLSLPTSKLPSDDLQMSCRSCCLLDGSLIYHSQYSIGVSEDLEALLSFAPCLPDLLTASLPSCRLFLEEKVALSHQEHPIVQCCLASVCLLQAQIQSLQRKLIACVLWLALQQ